MGKDSGRVPCGILRAEPSRTVNRHSLNRFDDLAHARA